MTALVPTVYEAEPSQGYSIYQVSYTKGAAGDTLNIGDSTQTYFTPIKTILFVFAADDGGVLDPVTWSSTTITLSVGTGSGTMIIVGQC